MGLVERVISSLSPSLRFILRKLPGARLVRNRLYGYPRGKAPEAGTRRPVVYLPTWTEWDVMPQRPQYMLEAFARAGHPVWFVDPRLTSPETRGDYIRLVPNVSYLPPRHVIIFCHYAPLLSLASVFEDSALVYDILDDLAIYDPDETHLPEEAKVRYHHHEMVRAADIVTVSNPILGPRHGGGREDVMVVENGVDLERFSLGGPVATEIEGKRVVGYHGAVAEWFDFDLMARVADLAPDLDFVVVGPVYDRVAGEMKDLTRRANVTHYPKQPGDRIPEFVRGFRVGLIPFLVDEMTEGVTPLKMFEYMACGVPVVATPLPACVQDPAVRTTADPEELVGLIRSGLGVAEAGKAELRSRAEEAAWPSRLAPVLARLEELGVRSV